MQSVDTEVLQRVYKELDALLGTENMLKIYHEFKGSQLNLPMRLYDRELTADLIRKLYPQMSVKELADKYGYSQRWVRQVLKK